jgi:peptide/nickel transport system ATP-binding protein
LLLDLKARLGTALLLITHDLGVVAEMADRVAVLYAGHVVEVAPVMDLFDRPRHPYTEGLLAAAPRLDKLVVQKPGSARLMELPGGVPGIDERPPGCPFAPRCQIAAAHCGESMPPVTQLSTSRSVACWKRAA